MPPSSDIAAPLLEQAERLRALTLRLGDARAAGLQLVLIVSDAEGNRIIGEAIDATLEVIRELDGVHGRLLALAYRADHERVTA